MYKNENTDDMKVSYLNGSKYFNDIWKEWECVELTSQSWDKPSWSMPSRRVISSDWLKAGCWWNINLRL